MKLDGELCDVHRLSGSDRDAMFQLMTRNYVNIRRSKFDSDLDAKRWVILVRSQASQCLVGFSTQVVLEIKIKGERVQALYSGDTVVDREYWGDPALAQAWGNFALQLVDSHGEPLFWLLTSKGFRTFRYLPLFFRCYYPSPDWVIPTRERSVIDAFGQRLGRGCYDSERQIIRASADKDYVRPEIAEPGLRRDTDRHVRFFVERNPGFANGDELCCLAPMTRANFTRAAWRVIGRASSRLCAT